MVGILSKARKLRREGASPETESIVIKHDPVKRAFDVLFSATALIALSPILGVVGLLVKFTTPGPVIYRSKRLGRGGKLFSCLKFRSMYVDADKILADLLASDKDRLREWNIYQKLRNDPRVTPIGRFLRKTSLDEMLQFWNVLKGDLSVVGPRPPTLMDPPDDYLVEIQKLYGKTALKILSVRPGITGIWQVSGRSQVTFAERSKMEAEYIDSRTFWSDLLVIIKTIPAVLFSKGAC